MEGTGGSVRVIRSVRRKCWFLVLAAALLWLPTTSKCEDSEFEQLLSFSCSKAALVLKEADQTKRRALREYLLVVLSHSAVGNPRTTLPEFLPDGRPPLGIPTVDFNMGISPEVEAQRRACALELLTREPASSFEVLPHLVELAGKGTLGLSQRELQESLVEALLTIARAGGSSTTGGVIEAIVDDSNPNDSYYRELVLRERAPQSIEIVLQRLTKTPENRTQLEVLAQRLVAQEPEAEVADLLVTFMRQALESSDNGLLLSMLSVVRAFPRVAPDLLELMAGSVRNSQEDTMRAMISLLAQQAGMLTPGVVHLSDSSLKALVEILATSSGKQRNELRKVLEQFGWKSEPFREALRTAYKQSSDVGIQGELLSLEGRFFGDEADSYARLVDAVFSKDVELRTGAIAALGVQVRQRATTVRHLAKLFSSRCEKSQSRTEPLDVALAVAPIISTLQKETALDALEGQPLVPCLWNAYLQISSVQVGGGEQASGNQSSREVLRAALSSLRSALPRVILRELRSKDDLARALASELLAPLAESDAGLRRQLVGLLEDTSFSVRDAVAHALSAVPVGGDATLRRLVQRLKLVERVPALQVLSFWEPSNAELESGTREWAQTSACVQLVAAHSGFSKSAQRFFGAAIVRCLKQPEGVRSEKLADLLLDSGTLDPVQRPELASIVKAGTLSSQTTLMLLSGLHTLGFSLQEEAEGLLQFALRSEGAFQVQALLLLLKNKVPLEGIRAQLESLSTDRWPVQARATALVLRLRALGSVPEIATLQQLLKSQSAESIGLFSYVPWDLMQQVVAPWLAASRESEVVQGLRALEMASRGATETPLRVLELSRDPRLAVQTAAINLMVDIAAHVPDARTTAQEAVRRLFLDPANAKALGVDDENLKEILRVLADTDASRAVRGLARSFSKKLAV